MADSKQEKALRWRSHVWIFLFGLLALSFFYSPGWLALCAGLALFLFGMQCLEEGLRLLTGGKLERVLARSTSSPFKSLLFGVISTAVVQSSSLVSLLTIAFISTGLITLTAGIAIVLGANLGTTSGIWLLALAGQKVSLSPIALPFLVFGVLGNFTGPRGQAVGRVALGIAFLFLGIDQMRDGFSTLAGNFDPLQYQVPGLAGLLLYTAIGILITVLLQSSHATLMLILTALGSGHLAIEQGFALAIGSNVGTTITAIIGAVGGARSGQRLALAHVLFNLSVGVLALTLLGPISAAVYWIAEEIGYKGNLLIELAIFHTLFNAMGVLLFWPWLDRLTAFLEHRLPDHLEPAVLITDLVPQEMEPSRARYLDESALASADTALRAVLHELQHLGRLSLEVICHALFLPVEQLDQKHPDPLLVSAKPKLHEIDADQLYQLHVKGVYSDLLTFMSRLDIELDQPQQQFQQACQRAAMELVDAVKDAKHLQKNLGNNLRAEDSTVRREYVELRRHIISVLQEIREISRLDVPPQAWAERLQLLDEMAAQYDNEFRARLFVEVRSARLSGDQASSLMNDLGYASRIIQSLRNVLLLGRNPESQFFGSLRQILAEDRQLIFFD
jgi:phosphate:Na+ symporter